MANQDRIINNTSMNHCGICSSLLINDLYGKNGYNYWFCRDCQTIFLNPKPDLKELSSYYESDFQYTAGKSEEQRIRKRSQKIVGRLFSLNPEGKTLLDIGSGYGYFLEEAIKQGLDVTGIEPSKRLAKKPVLNMTFEEFYKKSNGRKFDFITLIHVIEHVSEPREFIKKISELLSKKGILYIETPNSDSWLRNFEKEQYTFLTPPDHIWIFSPKSLKKILDRRGLTIKSLSTYSHPEHFMGIVKRLLYHNPINLLNQLKFHEQSQQIKKSNSAKHLIFDKMIAPLITPLLDVNNKGSILELYVNKK